MNLYICRVYCFNYADASVEKADWTTTQVPRCGRATLPGESARQAAAEAYVNQCGFARSLSMHQLGCPETVVDFEQSPERVAQSLKQSVCWKGPCYYFDNGVEIFFIVVKALDPQKSQMVRQRAMVRFMCSN